MSAAAFPSAPRASTRSSLCPAPAPQQLSLFARTKPQPPPSRATPRLRTTPAKQRTSKRTQKKKQRRQGKSRNTRKENSSKKQGIFIFFYFIFLAIKAKHAYCKRGFFE
ncbi:hypothetical protein V6Z11_D11G119900 [Gossypium hirsutum]